MLIQKHPLTMVLIVVLASCSQPNKEAKPDYPVTPIPFTAVHLDDQFWLPRILTNTDVTIPIAFGQSEETGRIKNFEVAGGLKEGTFCTKYAFDDSDVFKIIEGASYSLMITPDPELESYLDSLIYKIAAAQEPDGYLYTNRTILGDSAHQMAGPERWSQVNEHSHELYNVGHIYEAAVAHFQATGKKSFLNVAIKNADLIDKEFGWGKIEKYPGHQEIEIGLTKLYRITGDERYLTLARFFLDVRGPGGWEYNQAHLKPIDQREPVGHAVRALYMYSAMADIAALTGDTDYQNAIESIWEHLINKKIYITGGIGQAGGNEGFGDDYHLPNKTAYCETCASIANVFWNHRMFLLSGNSKYVDILERTLYNALLSGVSLNGELFFYPNRLESDGTDRRQAWYGCACCPSNIARFLPSVPGYIYAKKENDIYINLFISSKTEVQTRAGKMVITQKSDYPWNGDVLIKIIAEKQTDQRLLIRIPTWTSSKPIPGELYYYHNNVSNKPVLKLNGETISYQIDKGYLVLDQTWNGENTIELSFEMPIRKSLAMDSVTADKDRFVLERGPLVYCLEETDSQNADVRNSFFEIDENPNFKFSENILNGTNTIEIRGMTLPLGSNGSHAVDIPNSFIGIPYAYWANRKPGEMIVWLPYKEEAIEIER